MFNKFNINKVEYKNKKDLILQNESDIMALLITVLLEHQEKNFLNFISIPHSGWNESINDKSD